MGRKYLFLICLSISIEFFGQTTLHPGDVALVQYNSTETVDVIKFVTFVFLDVGTEIHFTDRGWISETSEFRTEGSDGLYTWVATSSYGCGSVITVDLHSGVDLRVDGDQLLVYQGGDSNPNFIFALNNQGTDGEWQTTAINNRSSGIPLGLTNTVNAVALPDLFNAMYDAGQIENQSRPEILTSICNKDNWVGSETMVQDFQGLFQSEALYPSTFWTERSQQNQSSYFHVQLISDYNTDTQGAFKTCTCSLSDEKTLTIAGGDMVVVESTITNHGTFVIEDNGAIVQTAGLDSNKGTGNYIVQKSSSLLKSEGLYTYWSSPTSDSFFAHAIDVKLVYSYDAVMQLWVDELNTEDPMVPGKGYAATGRQGISYPATVTASFQGNILNNGNVVVPLGFSNDLDDTNDANFIGNPYPSALDAEKFVAGNSNLAGYLYFWTHNSNDTGKNSVDDYVFWNLTGGIQMCLECVEPNGKISVGQGFFVQAIAGGSVTFTNNMRIKEPNTNAIFYKEASKHHSSISTNEKNRIRLNLTVNDSFSQVLIGFIQGATGGVDRLYDAPRGLPESSSDDNFSFFAFVNDAYFAILGQAPLNESEIIPLGFSSNFTGDFEISIGEKEGLLNTASIGLFDKETQTLYDLNTGPYAFSAQSGLYENRFELHIQSTEINADHDLETFSESPISIEIKDGILELHTVEKIKSIAIFDLLGRAQPYQKIYANDTKTGILVNRRRELIILKIQLDSGKMVVRKIIYE